MCSSVAAYIALRPGPSADIIFTRYCSIYLHCTYSATAQYPLSLLLPGSNSNVSAPQHRTPLHHPRLSWRRKASIYAYSLTQPSTPVLRSCIFILP
jgi:hypothetical protein